MTDPRKRRRRRRQPIEPWTKERRDPAELLARLVGRGRGGGSSSIADSDLTCALGYCEDKLGAMLAMSVAGRTDHILAPMARATFRRLYRIVQDTRGAPLNLRDGADRHRLRMVTLDVLETTIWPERSRSMKAGAQATKMREERYREMYRLAEARIREWLANGSREFAMRLWAENLERRVAAARQADATITTGVMVMRCDEEPWKPEAFYTGPSLPALVAMLRCGSALMRLVGEAVMASSSNSLQVEYFGAPYVVLVSER